MKKILIVIPTLVQGGGQKFVLDLAKGIDKNKYQVKILTYYDLISDCFFKDFKQLDEECVEIIKLNKKKGLDLSFFSKVKKVVREYDPDVIHSNLDTLLYLFGTFRKKQVKLHTVHTLAQKEAIGLQKIVRKIAFKGFKVLPVAISDVVAESVKEYYKITEVPVAYNGVRCCDYVGERKYSDKVRLMATGTLYPVKNYEYLIDCFYEIAKTYPNTTLTILGDGPLRNDLQKKIETLGLVDKVTLMGEVSNVKAYLLDADIFVSSSIYEGLPLSMLEAMASGLPVVANDVGGIKEIVQNDYNGYIVPLGDKDAYIKSVEKLILNLEKRENASINAKTLASEFDEKKTVELYEKLYENKKLGNN